MEKVTYLRRKLLEWWRLNKRSFPWRETDDPYKLLIAEIMLQRTKAKQVKSVYKNFFKEFSNPEEVIKSSRKKLKCILKPLGLNKRVNYIIDSSKDLVNKHSGEVPSNRDKLMELKGVGQYVAGITLAVGYHKKEWAVDSNIKRIFNRFFSLEESAFEKSKDANIKIAKSYTNTTKPKQSQLSIIDFGAKVCKPKNPKCKNCTLKRKCDFY